MWVKWASTLAVAVICVYTLLYAYAAVRMRNWLGGLVLALITLAAGALGYYMLHVRVPGRGGL